MSEQDNTIRALQIQCATNAKKLDQLRALNRKLRAELVKSKQAYEAMTKISDAHFSSWKAARRDEREEARVGEVWKEAFSKLAESIGGKAK